MKLSFSKKAGLQMSINAIVILVMAMVVLGLGLGFIRGMFSSAENKFIGAISNVDLTNPATAAKPITFEKSTITVKKSNSAEFMYSVYNNYGSDLTNVTLSVSSCSSSAGFQINSVGAPIQDGDYTTFMGLLVPPTTVDLTAGTYICTVAASGDEVSSFASAQLSINLVS